MLLKERFDTFIETEVVGDYFIAQEGLTGQFEKAAFRHTNQAPVYLAVSKQSSLAEKLPQIQVILQQLVDEGYPEQMLKKYLAQ